MCEFNNTALQKKIILIINFSHLPNWILQLLKLKIEGKKGADWIKLITWEWKDAHALMKCRIMAYLNCLLTSVCLRKLHLNCVWGESLLFLFGIRSRKNCLTGYPSPSFIKPYYFNPQIWYSFLYFLLFTDDSRYYTKF